MESRGRIESITQDFRTKEYLVTLRIPDLPVELEGKDLDVKIVQHKRKRSLDANAFFWACVGDIAKAIGTDKDEVYAMLLQRYGVYTTLSSRMDAFQELTKIYKLVDVVGTYRNIDGSEWATFRCYYGSSLYDVSEMSALIEGTLSEMDEMHLQKPPSLDLKMALEQWEKTHG